MTSQEQLVDFIRELADIPNGVSLLTLLLQAAHRRLVNNVRASERAPPGSPENSQRVEQRPQATAQPPGGQEDPSEPSEPSEPDESEARHVDDRESRASSHGKSMLDNRLRTRYNDAELVDATSKMIGKEVVLPKRKDVKEELARWRSEVTLRFPLYELDAIPYESERYDSQLGYVNPKYYRWYDTRRVMAFTAMALSLDMNLRDLFKVDELREDMEAPSLLWDELREEMEAPSLLLGGLWLTSLDVMGLTPTTSCVTYSTES
ncbi:hypothetical protein GN958_ATG08784 [Phytophthora infestans]|uniref:Uncharacterized protein n=1 Tax=Phytophthora infestans TaxID=4787 RepID=A0A8S9USL2_PHYIN|nr:hypothetical protein GN958_ATG08784 [Phytophthora infestans]